MVKTVGRSTPRLLPLRGHYEEASALESLLLSDMGSCAGYKRP